MQGRLNVVKKKREINETKTGPLLARSSRRLHTINSLFFSYRKTLVYVHTTRGITTVHHKARVAGASREKNNKSVTHNERGWPLTMHVTISLRKYFLQ